MDAAFDDDQGDLSDGQVQAHAVDDHDELGGAAGDLDDVLQVTGRDGDHIRVGHSPPILTLKLEGAKGAQHAPLAPDQTLLPLDLLNLSGIACKEMWEIHDCSGKQGTAREESGCS